tara:strand:+ start:51 stop:392 length:342 start_codon:yes stop_codon:yes gene_type:complete
MEESNRPWGKYTVIKDESNFKLKIIEVNPGQRLSYQYHNKRSEVWTIVEGNGEVIIDGKKNSLKYGDCIKIDKTSKHRIHNNSDAILKFIEVQTGSYFGEDDIVRIDDDYNRI